MKKILVLVLLCFLWTHSAYALELISEQTAKANLADGDMFLGEIADNSDFVHTTIAELKTNTFQTVDSDLTSIAALTTATYGRALLEAASELAFQQLVNLEIGVDTQAYDTGLNALSGKTPAANKIPYYTGAASSGLLDFKDENDMVSDSSTAVASQSSVKKYVDDAVAAGVADGDKGDITVSGTGTVYTVDNDAVTYAKIQDVSATDKVLGRETAGAGVVEEIDLTAFGRSIIDDANEATFKATVNLEIGTDVLAEQTVGIADDNLVEIDDAAAADDEFARFTANGLEGRSYAEAKADLSLEDADINTLITATKLDDLTAPDDNTDLNVSITAHGLVPKGTNTGTAFLRDDATWAVPAGAGDVAKVGTPVNNEIGVWTGDGTIEGDTNFQWDGAALKMLGTMLIKEQAAAAADVAAYGQVWVKNDVPNTLWFTDDAGTDYNLLTAGGTIDVSGVPVDDDWARFTDADTVEGLSDSETITALGLVRGIADDNLLEVDDAAAADNQYARFTANGLEGRTEAEFKGDFNLEIGTDVLAEKTIGIADDNLVEVDGTPVNTEVAIWTANGLDSKNEAEFKTAFNLETNTDFYAPGGTDVPVTDGGSGASTFTDGGILLGSGTGAFTALGVAANGQIPIGDGTTDPVLANITEATDALVITNGAGTIVLSAHANVEAVADACAGVAAPLVGLYDSNNAGTDETCGTGDKLAGTIEANCTTTTEDSEDCDLILKSMEGGTNTQRAMFDQSDGQWEFDYPVSSGVTIAVNAGSPVTLDADLCEAVYWNAGVYTYNLPAEPRCNGVAGNAKKFCFGVRGANTLTIDPNGTDYINHGGSLGDGVAIDNSGSGAANDFICLYGTGSDEWFVGETVGTWDVP